MVLNDGTYVIDHFDEDNPDQGRPGQHFFTDVLPELMRTHPVVTTVALAVLGVGVGRLLGTALESNRSSR